jgi:hypothetical protein
MAQEQVVNAATERREQFIVANIHRTENGVLTACRPDLVRNRHVDYEIAHPI